MMSRRDSRVKGGLMNNSRFEKFMKVLFVIWLVLFVPWIFIAPLAIMAFDSGETQQAYIIVFSIWTYPVTVGIAARLRKKTPEMTLLPFLNVLGMLASGF